jgi:hypothetical protein
MGQQQGQQGDLVAQEWGCQHSWEAVDGEAMNNEACWCQWHHKNWKLKIEIFFSCFSHNNHVIIHHAITTSSLNQGHNCLSFYLFYTPPPTHLSLVAFGIPPHPLTC